MSASKLTRSFTATLNILGIIEDTSQAFKLQIIDENAGPDFAETGWLVLAAHPRFYRSTTVTLRFDLLDEATQLFRISCESPASYAGKRLDTSRNGYLGFYANTGDQVFWHFKIVSGQPGEGMVIQIYDMKGNVVSYFDDLYLGVGGAKPALSFEVADYREV
jgi:hypothetical protein